MENVLVVLICALLPTIFIIKYFCAKSTQELNYWQTSCNISIYDDKFLRIIYMIEIYITAILFVTLLTYYNADSFILKNIVRNIKDVNEMIYSITTITIAIIAFLSIGDSKSSFIFRLKDVLNEMHTELLLDLSISSMFIVGILKLCLPNKISGIDNTNTIGEIILILESAFVINVISNAIFIRNIVAYIFENRNTLQSKLYRVYPYDSKIKNEINIDNLDDKGIIAGLEYYFSLYMESAKKMPRDEKVSFIKVLEGAGRKYIVYSCVVAVFLQIVFSLIGYYNLAIYDKRHIKQTGIVIIVILFIHCIISIVYTCKERGQRILLPFIFDSMYGIKFENNRGYIIRGIKSNKGVFGKRRKFINSIECFIVYASLMITDRRINEEFYIELNEYLFDKIEEIKDLKIDDEYRVLPFCILLYLMTMKGFTCSDLKKILVHNYEITERELKFAKDIVTCGRIS